MEDQIPPLHINCIEYFPDIKQVIIKIGNNELSTDEVKYISTLTGRTILNYKYVNGYSIFTVQLSTDKCLDLSRQANDFCDIVESEFG